MLRRAALGTRDIVLLAITAVLLLVAVGYWVNSSRPEPVPEDLAANVWFKCEACKASFQYGARELAEIIQKMPGGGPSKGSDLRYVCKKCGQRTAIRDFEHP